MDSGAIVGGDSMHSNPELVKQQVSVGDVGVPPRPCLDAKSVSAAAQAE